LKSFTAILLTLLSAAAHSAESPLAGFWQGEATRNGETLTLQMEFTESPEGINGTLSLPEYGVLSSPFDAVTIKRSKVTVQHPYFSKEKPLEGKRKGDTILGSWEWKSNGTICNFSVKRIPDPRPYTKEDVRFTNPHDGIELAGTLLVPKTPGPHPGIMMIHGSGDNVRWPRTAMADLFARQGMAALIYDKRGCGESTGDWETVGFEALAQDGNAGLAYLKSRDDIDPSRLGFWGISQAGWIMPLSAKLSDDVSFIVVTSGATVTVEEEGYFDYIVRLRDAGFSESDQAEALKILKQDFHVSMTGEGYDELRAMVKEAKDKPWWKPLTFFAAPPNITSRHFYRLIGEYDPIPILENLDIPILWIYGEEDKSVEPTMSIPKLNRLIEEQEKEYEVVMFPDADHGLRIPTAKNAAFPLRPHAPGYLDTIVEWIEKKGFAGN
jgi:pimeloyl-ACP methyl ester carboxylesterase